MVVHIPSTPLRDVLVEALADAGVDAEETSSFEELESALAREPGALLIDPTKLASTAREMVARSGVATIVLGRGDELRGVLPIAVLRPPCGLDDMVRSVVLALDLH